MPFLDDTGVRDDPTRGPVAEAFATFSDQVERLVAVNVLWALQVVPAMVALALPGLPTPVRALLAAYSALVLPPATAVLYATARAAARREHVGVPAVLDAVRDLLVPGVRTLGVLFGAVGLLLWVVVLSVGVEGLGVVVAVGGWLALVTAVLASYWGPAFAADPDRGPLDLVRASLALAWAQPGRTIRSWSAMVGIAVVGMLSVGGFFLVVPILLALMQTTLHQRVAPSVPSAEEARHA